MIEAMKRKYEKPTPTVLKRIAALSSMSPEELKEKWRDLFGTEPPKYKRAFMIRRLTYRIQELAYGGLKDSTRKRMNSIIEVAGLNELAAVPGKGNQPPRDQSLPPEGTILIREWKGERHEVLVLHQGFELNGRKYRSLTSVAKAITGSQWNGWVFFGLKRPKSI